MKRIDSGHPCHGPRLIRPGSPASAAAHAVLSGGCDNDEALRRLGDLTRSGLPVNSRIVVRDRPSSVGHSLDHPDLSRRNGGHLRLIVDNTFP